MVSAIFVNYRLFEMLHCILRSILIHSIFRMLDGNFFIMYLTTSKDIQNLDDVLAQCAKLYATVFSTRYAKLICAALIAQDNETLDGFSDMEAKYFPQGFAKMNEMEIRQTLHDLLNGPGFSDEAALIKTFYDLAENSSDAPSLYEQRKNHLTLAASKDISDYIESLNKHHRVLIDVGLVFVSDNQHRIRGFSIYHQMKDGDKHIIHIRQAAMLPQGQGYASMMARYFADNFPTCQYEANQRTANPVAIKEKLVSEHLLEKIPAVLGYNNNFYTGLRCQCSIIKLLIEHYDKADKRHILGIRRQGNFWEMESIPNRFFRATQYALDKESFSKVHSIASEPRTM